MKPSGLQLRGSSSMRAVLCPIRTPSLSRRSQPGVAGHHSHCWHRRPAAKAAITTAAAAAAARPVPAVRLDPEEKAHHSRPPGWRAPGPAPVGPSGQQAAQAPAALQPSGEETLSFLTGDWRIFQLKDGHRWSMDDMMTAYVALQEAAAMTAAAAAAGQAPQQAAAGLPHRPAVVIKRTLDIGCGIGSVLLMVAWGLRRQHMEQQALQQETGQQAGQQAGVQQQQRQFHITSLGVEAQDVSFRLAARSIRYNVGDRAGVQVLHHDLRQPLPPAAVSASHHHSSSSSSSSGSRDPPLLFELITGTPPYIPEGAGGRSGRPQKAPCCLEMRGGVEDYCQAAAAALAPGGVFVVCGGIQGQPARFKGRRAQLAAAAAGLVITRQVTVVTRDGKPPLFAVYVMRRVSDVLQEWQHWQHWLSQGKLPAVPASLAAAAGSSSLDVGDAAAAGSVVGDAAGFERQVASGQLDGVEELLMVRHADGSHSAAWHKARAAMGLPPLGN